MDEKGVKVITKHSNRWTVYVCGDCGKRCLNEYNLQEHQVAAGHE